jgi:two-component system sensor histidine kinase VicK
VNASFDLGDPNALPAIIIESAADAVVAKDLNGVVCSWNPAAEQLFGFSAPEIVGSPIRLLFPPSRVDEDAEIIRRVCAGEVLENYQTIRQRKDGMLINVNLTISPIRDEHGHIIGISNFIRRTMHAESDEARRQLAAIVESSDDAIISKDLDGTIKTWNHGAERLFGYAAHEIIGRSVLTLIPDDRKDEEPAIVARLRRGERVGHYETLRRRKDGSCVEISLTVSPVIDGTGRVVGASKIARDISFQKQVLRELQIAHEKAVAANRAKDDFIATVTHELRTPLTPALLVSSAAAGDPALPEEIRQDFEEIRKHVQVGARLIDDLSDLTRISSGKLSLNLGTYDLHDIVREAVQIIQSGMAAKKQTLRWQLTPGPLPVEADHVRLQQVFWNVLKNASKFTPDGGSISIVTERNAAEAVLRIEDTGCGLDPAALERIFEPFVQADAAHSKAGGLGLGLAIARHILELHGGSISAASAGPGQGATFTIRIPLLPNA